MTWTKEREDWIRECVSRNPEMETVEGHDWRGRAADLLSGSTPSAGEAAAERERGRGCPIRTSEARSRTAAEDGVRLLRDAIGLGGAEREGARARRDMGFPRSCVELQ